MSDKITEEKIFAALSTVQLPGSQTDGNKADGRQTDIVSAGAVSGLVIKDGHVAFTIEIDPAIAQAADAMRRQAEQAVSALPGILSASAMLTAHNQQKTASTAAPAKAPGPRETPFYQPATHLIAVASGKGGVGKSTTAINLALALSASGKKVGILDADIYGPSLPRLLGLDRKPEADGKKLIPLQAHGLQAMSIGFLVAADSPTIWRGPMVMSALEQMLRDVAWHQLDVLVIDMPPGTGDAQLTLAQRARLAGAVIVSTPQDLALIDARKGLNMFRKVDVPVLGIIENMSYFICPDCGARHDIFTSGGAEDEAARLSLPFLGAIPLDMDIRQAADAGMPIVISQPDSPHTKAYMDIAGQLIAQLDSQQSQAPKIILE